MRLLLEGKEYSKPEEIPDYSGYTIIVFDFPDDKGYYKKPYISMCVESWKRALSPVRIIAVLVDDEVISLSKWTQSCLGNKKFMTDSLRIWFVNKFDNCLYVDTDVYFNKDFNIQTWAPYYDNYVAKDCTGTFLYNKYKNSELLNDFFNFYEDTLSKQPFYDNGDIEAYFKFSRYRRKKGLPELKSLNVVGLTHFSCIYPWQRDCNHIVICLNPWLLPENSDNMMVLPSETFWPFMLYLYDKNLMPDLVYKAEDTDKIITFRN